MDKFVELNRKLENLLRFGVVASVDHVARRCTVNTGELVTQPMRWLVQRAGDAITQWAPSVGEHVAVFCPGGDPARGFIAPSLYSDDAEALPGSNTANTTIYPDGCVVSYDPEAHALIASLPDGGQATVTATGGITFNGDTIINGKLTVTDDADLHAKLHVTSDVSIDAGVKAADDVVAGTISLQHHKSTLVTSGSGTSGPPV